MDVEDGDCRDTDCCSSGIHHGVSPEIPGQRGMDAIDAGWQPPIVGTEISLELRDSSFSSFDGCNKLGGPSGQTELIAKPDGAFGISNPVEHTDIGCDSPPGVMEQAERYARALMSGIRYEIVGGRLEIADLEGVVRLVFLKLE